MGQQEILQDVLIYQEILPQSVIVQSPKTYLASQNLKKTNYSTAKNVITKTKNK